MLKLQPDHPATSFVATGKICADPRCATLIDNEAEICDECAGTAFTRLESIGARLCGWAGERPVVFRVPSDRPSTIGHARAEQVPDIDLQRFPNSEVVHRLHARIERQNNEWRVRHLGTNLLTVRGSELEPGQAVALRSGDMLQVGTVLLQFVAP
jgi:hypothetical protein